MAILVSTRLGLAEHYFAAPFQDQWENIYWWRETLKLGRLPDGYLLSQHNEHRILFPRLIYLAELKWFRGTNVLSLTATALVQLASAALLLRLATLAGPRPLVILALAVSLGLTFSAVQWENLFWGFQVQFVGVYAAGAWAIYLLLRASDREAPRRRAFLAGGLVLLAIATFTMANGLFAGVAAVMVVALGRRGWRPALIAGAATAVLLSVYLYGYHRTPHPAPEGAFVARYAGYLLAYLGNVFSLGQPELAIAVGVVGVAATLAMVFVVVREPVRDTARLSLVGVVLFIGMGAGVTALGRLGYGVEQALSSRYNTPAAWFWAAQALFWGLTAAANPVRLRRGVAGAALVLALASLPVLQWHGFRSLGYMREGVVLGTSALAGGVDDEQAFLRLYPEAGRVREFRPFLQDHRLSVFADHPGFVAGETLPASRIAPFTCRGAFDLVDTNPADGRNMRALGWAWDVEADGPFEHVLIAEPSGRILGLGVGRLQRPDVRKAVREVDGLPGWLAVTLPSASPELIAYGVRSDGRVCELGRKPLTP